MDFHDKPYIHISPDVDDMEHLDETNTTKCPCQPDWWLTYDDEECLRMVVEHNDQYDRAEQANLIAGAA